jgi:hypothetical protein
LIRVCSISYSRGFAKNLASCSLVSLVFAKV